jgi:hypothetical protein
VVSIPVARYKNPQSILKTSDVYSCSPHALMIACLLFVRGADTIGLLGEACWLKMTLLPAKGV